MNNEIKIPSKALINDNKEGFVMRRVCSSDFNSFGRNVVKYVRANHVQTDEHWGKIGRKIS